MEEDDYFYGSTLADVQEIYDAAKLNKALLFCVAPDHDRRLQILEEILERSYEYVVIDRQVTSDESENQISLRIVRMLNMAGLNASHDTQWGGHVDIAVSGPDGFHWIGEAKIDGGNSKLKNGYLQLSTRYIPGQYGADCGELVIYGKKKDALRTLRKWAKHIAELDDCEVEDDQCEDRLWFRTSHISQTSGRRIRIRHRILPLWFRPEV